LARLREANVPSECLKIRAGNDFHDATLVRTNEAIPSRSDASHFP